MHQHQAGAGLAASSAIKGSNRKPEMSLTISAPASSATRATAALVVSIEMGMEEASCSIIGITRRSSSASETNQNLAASIRHQRQ